MTTDTLNETREAILKEVARLDKEERNHPTIADRRDAGFAYRQGVAMLKGHLTVLQDRIANIALEAENAREDMEKILSKYTVGDQ